MLQLKNTSPFAPAIAVFPNQNAIDTLYIVVKATFTLDPRLAVAEVQSPPVLADEYWGEPATSSLKYASELHVGKPSTDVILVGQAWVPRGRPAADTVAMVAVADRRKVIRVLGDRVWKSGGAFSAPEPFVSMPLVYERAFGGMHRVSDDGPILAEERNPVGVGFAGKRSRGEMVGQKLPNLEEPTHPLESATGASTPATFGFVAPSWLPRRQFAGTYDQAWKKNRAPYLPADFSPRFFNMAAPELTFDRFLAGGETVDLLGVSRHGPLQFALPHCQPRADVQIAGSHESPLLNLETILIEPDENRICLSWRAQLSCDKKVLKVETVVIGVDRLDLGKLSS
jgi:hypothetical protein